MASEIKWKAPGETIQTALTTELNSLVDTTSDTTGFSALSAEIPNETDLYQYINIELVLATQGVARSTGAFVTVFISYALDGSDFGDDSNRAYAEPLVTFQLDAATTARQLTKVNIPIPPIDFKLYVMNDTGQTLAASANTLKYRRHNEQMV